MISRHWRGVAKADRADEYVQHLLADTLPAIRKLPGFVSASILRRSIAGGVEFVIVTHWASLEAIRRFAGDDVDAAVVPGVVQDMMVDYDRVVRHFDVVT